MSGEIRPQRGNQSRDQEFFYLWVEEKYRGTQPDLDRPSSLNLIMSLRNVNIDSVSTFGTKFILFRLMIVDY